MTITIFKVEKRTHVGKLARALKPHVALTADTFIHKLQEVRENR